MLSPQLKERIQKFRRSKRAYWSLVLLTTFFVLSLPAELICNDRPYVIRYQGRWFWPIFSSYSRRDFGIASDVPIDYRELLAELAAGTPAADSVPNEPGTVPVDPRDLLVYELFGDDQEQVDIVDLVRRQDAGENVCRYQPPNRNRRPAAPPPSLVQQLFGDDNEQVDIRDLVRRQDLGEDVLLVRPRPDQEDAGPPPSLIQQLFGDDNEHVDIRKLVRQQDADRKRPAPTPKRRPPQTDMERLIYQLYGDDQEDVDIAELARRQDAGEDVYRLPETPPAETARPPAAAEDLWTLWPPIRYRATTENKHHTTERANLINPRSYVSEVTGTRVPGAAADGHYLGTDSQGRDVVARLVYGFRVSLLFGFGLALSGTLLGCLLGGLQGYFGGLTDLLGQRATEIWGSMPQLFLLIILSSFLASQATQLTHLEHFGLLFGILNLTAWMGMAGHMRAQFLRARNLDYVKAAKALGQSNFRIMLKHILPNSLVPVVTFMPFAITGGIAALVSLDFLGFGVKYPAPSLGDMLAQGRETMVWWIIFPTFIILAVTLILLTFIGEGVRNAFDPRRKG